MGLCYALLFPSCPVVILLVTYVTSYWLAGCMNHKDTSLESRLVFRCILKQKVLGTVLQIPCIVCTGAGSVIACERLCLSS